MLSVLRSSHLESTQSRLICIITFFLFLYTANAQDRPTQDVWFSPTSPSLVYTPFRCNTTEVLLNPTRCAGAWQISEDGQSISAIGPPSAGNNIIPQMFFQFQASKLFLSATTTSNATIDITLSSNGVSITSIFDSSMGTASIVNLPQNQVTLFTLSLNPSPVTTKFGLETIAITVPADASNITSLLPAPTIPPPASLPSASTSFSAFVSATSIPPKSHPSKTMIAQAVGLTVGLGLGLTFLTVAVLFWWKRRRRTLDESLEKVSVAEARSEWRGSPTNFGLR